MLYRFMWFTLGPLIRLYWRQRVRGRSNVPRGGVILASNHQSAIDPILICMSFWRPVQWLAKVELVKKWRIAWFFRAAEVIPVDREAPQEAAIEAAADALRKGNLFGIFPEGARSPDGRVYRGYTGVARIAERSGAPVVPTAVTGSKESIKKGSIIAKPVSCGVWFGAPMTFSIHPGEDEHTAYRRFTAEVMDAIATLAGVERVPERYAREMDRRSS